VVWVLRVPEMLRERERVLLGSDRVKVLVVDWVRDGGVGDLDSVVVGLQLWLPDPSVRVLDTVADRVEVPLTEQESVHEEVKVRVGGVSDRVLEGEQVWVGDDVTVGVLVLDGEGDDDEDEVTVGVRVYDGE